MLGSCRFNALHCVLLFSALCAYLACKDDEARPGAVGDCPDGCVGGPSPIRDAPGGSLGMGGTGGTGGSANAGAAGSASAGAAGSSSAEGSLHGSLQAVISEALALSPDLDGTVQVQAAGAGGDQVTTTSEPNGDFVLGGVVQSPNLWVGAGPFNGDANSTFLDTLQVVDSTSSAPVSLLVMRRRPFTDLVAESFLANPVELNPQRGHVILRFVNSQQQGIPGATLTTPAPASTSVAYDIENQIYSDTQTETGGRGTLVLVNLDASAYPGSSTTIKTQVRGTERGVDVHIAAGAVTIVTTVVP
jgi:hypothetical protein